MKKLRLLLFLGVISLVFVGCDNLNQLTGPTEADMDVSVYQRPEFVDTRPPEIIANFISNASYES